jgi:SAM-dependent methyltransferase
VDGGGAERWSAVADEWAELWGTFAVPVWVPVLRAAGVAAGSRVLDVGCGSGELLEHLAALGAVPFGVDPAPAMAARARERVPGADVREAGFDELPFDDGAFDAVVAVNSLQFAEDTLAALAEAARVLRPGGAVGIANWAEGARNDLDVVERAVADALEDTLAPDGDLRHAGGLESVLADAGLQLVTAGLADAPWTAADDDELVRGILFGEDPATMAELAPVVVSAARPFRTPEGGYRLRNAFRYAVARTEQR